MADVELSKMLAYVLRHGALKEGLTISSDGFIDLEEILKLPKVRKLGATRVKVEEVVATCSKKRFEINTIGDKVFIRASQGHSISVVDGEGGSLLRRIQLDEKFDVVVHGTFSSCWPLIEATGLNKMERNHIHFAAGYPEDGGVISGMRKSCDVHIEIDMQRAIADGIEFFQASNGVILTSGIYGVLPTRYFSRVVQRGQLIVDRSSLASGGVETDGNSAPVAAEE